MKPIFILGASASFLAGAALALMASYPVPEREVYVCFWALMLGMAGCILAAWAVVLHATYKQRVSVEKVIDMTVDALGRRRKLECVEER